MRTALIVEDEPEANKLLSMLVQLHGYATESAFTGSEALEKVRNHVPDVVFLDLMLPDLDGYEVCRALKSSGTTSQVPIVIVTARIAAENRIESFHAGADDYVPKPYTPDQIFEALDQSNARGRESTAPLIEGEVVLDGRDDGETLRRLARLRGLLLARSGLEPEAIESDQRGHQGDLVERRRVGASFGPGSGGDAGLRAFPRKPGPDRARRGRVAREHVGDLAEGPYRPF